MPTAYSLSQVVRGGKRGRAHSRPRLARSSFFSDGWRIDESSLALRADGVDEAPHTVVRASDEVRASCSPSLGQLDTVPERVAAEEARPADDLVGVVRLDASRLRAGVAASRARSRCAGRSAGTAGLGRVEEMEFEVAADAE